MHYFDYWPWWKFFKTNDKLQLKFNFYKTKFTWAWRLITVNGWLNTFSLRRFMIDNILERELSTNFTVDCPSLFVDTGRGIGDKILIKMHFIYKIKIKINNKPPYYPDSLKFENHRRLMWYWDMSWNLHPKNHWAEKIFPHWKIVNLMLRLETVETSFSDLRNILKKILILK